MSFRIYVSLKHDISPLPDDPDAIDEWMEEESRHIVYDEPLAGDNSFYNYWHTLACKMDINIMCKIYNHGFSSAAASELDDLRTGAERIKQQWEYMGLSDGVLSQLHERYEYLIEGIAIAKNRDCILTIS